MYGSEQVVVVRNLGAIIMDGQRRPYFQKVFSEIGPVQRILDLGCGKKPWKVIYSPYAETSFGIDVLHTYHGSSAVDAFFDGRRIPFQDATFDVVFCTEVMEHVPEPGDFLAEIHRVLRPGGRLVMTTPFMVPLHEDPWDFYRYTRYGIVHLLSKARFGDIAITVFGDTVAVLITLLVQVQLRIWHMVSRRVRWPAIYSIWNPFIFLLVGIPQWLYLAFRRSRVGARMLRPMEYTPRGYGYTARRL